MHQSMKMNRISCTRAQIKNLTSADRNICYFQEMFYVQTSKLAENTFPKGRHCR